MVGDVLAVLDDIGVGAVHVAGLAVRVPHAADDRVPDRGVQAVFLWTSRPLVISKTLLAITWCSGPA